MNNIWYMDKDTENKVTQSTLLVCKHNTKGDILHGWKNGCLATLDCKI